MAQYFTNFGEYSTGSFPNDWTDYYPDITNKGLIESLASSPGGQTFTLNPDDEYGNLLLGWDDVPTSNDTEVVVLLTTRGSLLNSKAGTRLTESEAGYYVVYDGQDTRIERRGSYSVLAQEPSTPNISLGSPYWMRIRASGNTLSGSSWDESEPEPSSWEAVATDSMYSSGFSGFRLFLNANTQLHAVGFGTAGDSAPTSPVALPGPNAPTGLTLTEL